MDIVLGTHYVGGQKKWCGGQRNNKKHPNSAVTTQPDTARDRRRREASWSPTAEIHAGLLPHWVSTKKNDVWLTQGGGSKVSSESPSGIFTTAGAPSRHRHGHFDSNSNRIRIGTKTGH